MDFAEDIRGMPSEWMVVFGYLLGCMKTLPLRVEMGRENHEQFDKNEQQRSKIEFSVQKQTVTNMQQMHTTNLH